LGAEATDVVAALRRLAAARLLVLDDADPPSIVMAHRSPQSRSASP
jgi:hypothetical protein